MTRALPIVIVGRPSGPSPLPVPVSVNDAQRSARATATVSAPPSAGGGGARDDGAREGGAREGGVRIVRREVPDVPASLHADPLARRVLAARGVGDAAELDFALAGLPPPDALPNLGAAVSRLLGARDAGEAVLVIGDYDCDGATSTAVALGGLAMLGFERVDFLVPDRVEYGYGLSPAIVELAAERFAPALILTVDNGVSSIAGVARARELGIDVVVTDHHLPGAELPRACAIVNPNLEGSAFPSGRLAGVGVIFYVLLALRARCRARAEAAGAAGAGPVPGAAANEVRDGEAGAHSTSAERDARAGAAPLADLLDLVAIGTVADVVELDRVNRTLVEQGLRRIRAGRTRPGVLALAEVAGRDPARLVASDIGFAIGPRLNAAGRIADMREGVLCLLAPDREEARVLAKELDRLNGERRRIEDAMRNEADARLAASLADGIEPLVTPGAQGPTEFGLVLHDPAWHEGVIGILAGRLKERWHRPVAVCTASGEGRIKGSIRSVPGVHARDVLQAIATADPELLVAFGGHAMAAGMTIAADGLERFRTAFDAEVRRTLDGRLPEREWLTDGELGAGELDIAHARLLRHLAPWGQGFEMPSFDGEFRVVTSRTVGNGHLKLTLRPVDGGEAAPALDAIAFRRDDALAHGDRIRLVYELDVNVWRDEERMQLMVRHLEPAA